MITFTAYLVLVMAFISMGISISRGFWGEVIWQFNTVCWILIYLVRT